MLEQCYENTRIIVDCHIKNILNMPQIKHKAVKDLHNVLDIVNENLKSLKVLYFDKGTFFNIILLNIVIDKLDCQTHKQKQYELTLKDKEVPSFNAFCEILRNMRSNSK